MMCVLLSFATELVLEGWRGLVTLLRSPVLCVEQGCVHWCLPGSPLQQRGVSQPSPLALGCHSTAGEQWVKGAAGRTDCLRFSMEGCQALAQCGWGQAGCCVWCAGRAAVLTHPRGWSHLTHSCSPWPCLINLLPWLHPAKHSLSWFLEP